MAKLQVNIVKLLAEKMARDERLYTIVDLQDNTDIDRRRLYVLRDNKVDFIRLSEIEALCKFFECKVDDLIGYPSPLDISQESLVTTASNGVAVAV